MKSDLQFYTTKKIIFTLPVVLTFCFIFLKIKFNYAYTKIIREDNLIENAEVIVYFLSSFFAFTIAIDFFKTRHKLYGLVYLILCLLLIFICGEEISWGQRIFEIEPPDYFMEHSVQEEINLHNLDIVHYLVYGIYVLVGFFGAFADIILRWINRRSNKLNYFIPDWFLTFYFIPVFLLFLYFCIYGFIVLFFGVELFSIENGSFIVWRDQEPAEFLLALGFLFFMIINQFKQKQTYQCF